MAVIVSMILLGALFLGLGSWGLAGAGLLRRDVRFTGPSLACCALALLLACAYFYGGVYYEDWSALMDTAGAMLLAACVLTGVSLLLNVAAWAVGRYRTRKT